jgi:hypothetical protein
VEGRSRYGEAGGGRMKDNHVVVLGTTNPVVVVIVFDTLYGTMPLL